ncbi:type I-E CRISPR-associated protein Cas5/CasD [Thalassomonas viridans]|uniref:Type I-E CRISPR-associated protein Cas5/CasD n=1 Tax=Thalassomonas viridans TaxID=137584 RepID=A0AAF0C904_9GAMM|nr:type I-E CRISPR-associated protein Cas5/CasD [Thalassomonas viridans]WDE04936.1 type I-E CRISPR-associated protein Cas5/CasD [Thalassomonas viridans]
MKAYLVFRLYGPLASWGQAAVGGDRPTGMLPTRSAILGLLGAALGIRRDDDAALQALQQSVQLAIKQTVPGVLLRDYHTTQVPGQNKKVRHRTRKSELSEDKQKLNTILSGRDYRCDGLWIVAISLTDKASVSLAQLQAALLTPAFPLCLGRKSCPLALPVMPKVLEPGNLKAALDTEFPPLSRSEKQDRFLLGANNWVTYYWEGDEQALGEQEVMTTHPWDEPVSRTRWQFKQGTRYQVSLREKAHVSV